MIASEFFETLGYLANPASRCKLDAEMHHRSQSRFEEDYEARSGIKPSPPDNQNYYVLHSEADKWGVELRVYFFSTQGGSIPVAIQPMVVSSRPGSLQNRRINNNTLIWDLIEYGFLLGDIQNEARIRRRVPPEHMADFESGFSLV